MKNLFNRISHLTRVHKGLFTVLFIFFIAHWWLWFHYYATLWGMVRHFSFFSPRFLFSLMAFLYWVVYSAILLLGYSFGKKTFVALVIFYFFSIFVTVTFSLMRVDLSPKFAVLAVNAFRWSYISGYMVWIVGSLTLLFLSLGILIPFLWKTYRKGLKIRKGWQILFLFLFFLSMGWHLFMYKGIWTEFYPQLVYDNEMGRFLRSLEGFSFFQDELFPTEKENLPGKFQRHETMFKGAHGVHVVYSILDTLQYEYLSFHGNPGVPRNPYLTQALRKGILVDFGPVLSCGSHTTASMPNMYSMNGCRLGPKIRSETLPHLMTRIGVSNHYVGISNLSQYYYFIFEANSPKSQRVFITQEDKPNALEITAQKLSEPSIYPKDPSSFTSFYYDGVHPGLLCSFLTAGGFAQSECQNFIRFDPGTPEYPRGMSLAVRLIERDLANFIRISENNPRPILLLLTADHGLGKNFFHGDMADAEIPPDQIEGAVQRHTNVLIYGNNAYRHLFPERWRTLQGNARKFSGWLNHKILVPTLIDALAVDWRGGEKILSQYSLFSKALNRLLPKQVKGEGAYLNDIPALKSLPLKLLQKNSKFEAL